MKTHIFKVIAICFVFLTISCNRNTKGCEVDYPYPSENPIIFTSEAQSKETYIENLFNISQGEYETDKVIYDDNHSQMIIENSWLRFTIWGTLPDKTIKIDVKENTSIESRKYVLKIKAKVGDGELTIIQKGKNNN